MRERKRSKKQSAGAFVRFDPEIQAWLEARAKADGDRSVASLIRQIVAIAKTNEEFGTRAA